MEQRQRAHLINSLGGFKSVCLIGTTDNQRRTNLAIFSSIFHIGANTLSNILETGVYTINHLNESIYEQAHQTSARYPKEISEFDATGLTPEFKNAFQAPYILESKVQMGIRFRERIDLTINGTVMIIGEITDLYFPPECLAPDGFLDLEKAGTLTCSGLDSYHSTRFLARLPYAKVK
jgi:flavin reductase (DIM6/NTAB) family NADH-FMN oxidoreductase RutF